MGSRWFLMSHVCARWRSFALNSDIRGIWGDVGNEFGNIWLKEMISRAGPRSPLSVAIPLNTKKDLSGLLEQQLHRIQRLSLAASDNSWELLYKLISAPGFSSVRELKVTTPFDFPWELAPTCLGHLTALDITLKASPSIGSHVDDIVAALQNMPRLTHLGLHEMDIHSKDLFLRHDRPNRVATLKFLVDFALCSTISGAYSLLRRLLIPSDTVADIYVRHTNEGSEDVRNLFEQVHKTKAIPGNIPAYPIRKLHILRKSREKDDTSEAMMIHTSQRDGGLANLSLRLEKWYRSYKWDGSICDRDELRVHHAAMASGLVESENLEELVADAFSFDDWDDAQTLLPHLRVVEAKGESSINLCHLLWTSMRKVQKPTKSTTEAQEIPFPRLKFLTLSSFDIQFRVSAADEETDTGHNTKIAVGDVLVELIGMRARAGLHLEAINFRESTIPSDFWKRLKEADRKMSLRISEDETL
ncbi:hypothetical protein FA95DRAFT_1572745 [Auriscalpium vulgare]|uniref:Uncharacterized protein n=1 Tax=Auriscalpium vulgare TaxID=40419 RepID=A0ACB8RTE1_9AGAM|nr:hypothetical protein FA95DRAFT_1572745 [Auriscalpium vulgare]